MVLVGLTDSVPLAAFVPLHPLLAVQLVGLFVALQPKVALEPEVMVLGLTLIVTAGFDVVVPPELPPPLLGGVVVPPPELPPDPPPVLAVSEPVLTDCVPSLAVVTVVVWPVVGSVVTTTFSPVAGFIVSVTCLPSAVVVIWDASVLEPVVLLNFSNTDSGTSNPTTNKSPVNEPAVIILIATTFLNLMTSKTPRYEFCY